MPVPAPIKITFAAEPRHGTILCLRHGHGSGVYRLDDVTPAPEFLTPLNIASWNAACKTLGWPKEKFL